MFRGECFDASHEKYGKTFVRESTIRFDPEFINTYFELHNENIPPLNQDEECQMVDIITSRKSNKWVAKIPSSSLICM